LAYLNIMQCLLMNWRYPKLKQQKKKVRFLRNSCLCSKRILPKGREEEFFKFMDVGRNFIFNRVTSMGFV
jgi:hypothetical protein